MRFEPSSRQASLAIPIAEDYLANTLIERRDKIGRYWLTRKSSIDNFTFEDGELRFSISRRSSISPEGRKSRANGSFSIPTPGSANRLKARTPPRPEAISWSRSQALKEK